MYFIEGSNSNRGQKYSSGGQKYFIEGSNFIEGLKYFSEGQALIGVKIFNSSILVFVIVSPIAGTFNRYNAPY